MRNTVNSIALGYVKTEMIKSMDEKNRNQWLEKIPMKCFAKPEEIAKFVLFYQMMTQDI